MLGQSLRSLQPPAILSLLKVKGHVARTNLLTPEEMPKLRHLLSLAGEQIKTTTTLPTAPYCPRARKAPAPYNLDDDLLPKDGTPLPNLPARPSPLCTSRKCAYNDDAGSDCVPRRSLQMTLSDPRWCLNAECSKSPWTPAHRRIHRTFGSHGACRTYREENDQRRADGLSL